MWATADGRRPRCRSRSSAAPDAAPRRHGAGAALRLRLLRGSIDPYFSVARLSLLDRGVGVRDRARARRRRDGPALVRRRQAARQAQHVHRLRRLRPSTWSTTGWTAPGPARRRGRQRRRPADGRGRQPGARAVRAAIVAEVPFVDALTTILDPTLPLTVIEWEEWGNPLDDPEVYAYMKSYAPYENVAASRLPADPGRRPRSTTPGCCTSSRPSGSPGCARPRPDGRRRAAQDRDGRRARRA